MDDESKLKLVKNFIYNDEVQNILSKINDNVMDFNILEITGMGTQEIKHSNILGWLFDDSEHNLEYQILDGFLKKVIQENNNECDKLLEYIYLANRKRDITIYREKDNIDLLIVDEANKVVITIENKVYYNERTEGEDGGQLKSYEDRIDKKYTGYNQYFIFLTINLEKPSRNWLKASHKMVSEVIENILKTKETSTKTKIILESYVDLLKRNGIVEATELEKLCNDIWAKKEYRDALNILIENKSLNFEKISNIVTKKLKSINADFDLYADNLNDILVKSSSISNDLYEKDKIFYNITFGYDGIFLNIYIDPDDNSFDILYEKLFPNKKKRAHSNRLLNLRSKDWDEYIQDTSIENLEEKIKDDLEKVVTEIKRCDVILKKNL